MDRNFWRDLYPISDTRKRLSRSSFLWIYLPIGAGALLAIVIAAAVLTSRPEDGYSQGAQLATVAMAFILLAAGFASWLVILLLIWELNDLLDVLPALAGRMRLRFVIGARSWKRRISGVKRIAAGVFRFFSPKKSGGPYPWEQRHQKSRRGGDGNG